MAMSPPPAMGADSISVWPPDNSPLALTVMVTSPLLTCVTVRREVEAGDTAFIMRDPPHATSATTSAAAHTPMTILRVISFRPSSFPPAQSPLYPRLPYVFEGRVRKGLSRLISSRAPEPKTYP